MPDEPVKKCDPGYTLIDGKCVKSPTPPAPSLTDPENEEDKINDEN